MMTAAGAAAWREFRAARERELTQPYGWVTLTGFHWLPAEPTRLPGVPGRWSTDGTEAYLEACAADGLEVAGDVVAGRSAASVAERGRVPWVRWNSTEIELLRRGGRLAIRLRAETSPLRESFAGVPVYAYDPAWVVTAGFRTYPSGETVDVGTHKPELRQRLPALGEVSFELAGRPQCLVVTTIKTGPSIEFHDPTNGQETEAWRQLKFAGPDAAGRVILDFNRTVNMWFAFTDHATCPRPAQGNTITVPVRAGEKRFAARGT